MPSEATFDVNASNIDSNFILRSHTVHSRVKPECFDVSSYRSYRVAASPNIQKFGALQCSVRTSNIMTCKYVRGIKDPGPSSFLLFLHVRTQVFRAKRA